MVESKGALLEEIAVSFFRNSGNYALRGVQFRFGEDDVTDLDVWTYRRERPDLIVRGVIDVKNKRSPKVFERILWVKGLQTALSCDYAAVVTTDNNPSSAAFARRLGVSTIPKGFLAASERAQIDENRVTHEQFIAEVRSNPGTKVDGDWLGILSSAKSRLVSQGGFPAFNRAMFALKFFSDRLEVRRQHTECALRCALLAASIACISLDMAMDSLTYDTQPSRFRRLVDGITYGDDEEGKGRQSIESALSVIAEASRNGRTIAAQARADLNRQLESIRADIVAEYFMRDAHSACLFGVAMEFEALAHSTRLADSGPLSVAARSILGIFADYLNIPRGVLPIAKRSRLPSDADEEGSTVGRASSKTPNAEMPATSRADAPTDVDDATHGDDSESGPRQKGLL